MNTIFSSKPGNLLYLFESELSGLRDLLESMSLEKDAILIHDASRIKEIMADRELILSNLYKVRQRRVELVKEMFRAFPDSKAAKSGTCTELETVLDAGEETSESILQARDEIIAILDKLQRYSLQNTHLLKNKVDINKAIMTRLGPKEKNPTYDGSGGMSSKKAKSRVALINQEV